MNASDRFFDTNVILYLFSADPSKAHRAEELLARGGQVSVQVLNELASVLRRKFEFSWREIDEIASHIRKLCAVTPLTVEVHVRGLQVAERHGWSVYDGMIVASALLGGCTTLHTEDMQDGQIVDGQVTIRNPFLPH